MPGLERQDRASTPRPQLYVRNGDQVPALRTSVGIPDDNNVGTCKLPEAERLVRRAAYDGPVEPGRADVIVDDVVTQGGTVADARAYIEARGGRVVAVTALMAPPENAILRIDPQQLMQLRERFSPETEAWWRAQFGYGWEGLTDSEAQRILRSFPGGDRQLRRALGELLRAERPGPDEPGGGGGDAGGVPPGGGMGGGGVPPAPRGPRGSGAGGAAPEGGGGVAEPPAGAGPAAISPFAGRQAAIAEASRQIEASIKLPDAARADLLEAQRVAAAAPDLAVPVGTGDAIGARGAAELLDMAEQGVQAAEAQAVCLLGAVVP